MYTLIFLVNFETQKIIYNILYSREKVREKEETIFEAVRVYFIYSLILCNI